MDRGLLAEQGPHYAVEASRMIAKPRVILFGIHLLKNCRRDQNKNRARTVDFAPRKLLKGEAFESNVGIDDGDCLELLPVDFHCLNCFVVSVESYAGLKTVQA